MASNIGATAAANGSGMGAVGSGGSSAAAGASVSATGSASNVDLDGRIRRTRGDGPIRFRTAFHNTIYDVMISRGWKETDSETEWDFQWADREWVYEIFDSVHLDGWQKLCRKDLLIKNVKRVKRQYEKDGNYEEAAKFDFCPLTFVLPGDYALFVEEFKRKQGQGFNWIMKPIGRAQGKGIFLFSKLSQISQWKSDYRWRPDNPSVESYVVQQYIGNPHLVGGKKFDIRIYVLVTSFQPLTVWLYRSGFARFSASHYSKDPGDIVNNYVHLTNVAIQKTADNYNAETGGKWSLRELKLYLMSKYGRKKTDDLFYEMQMICVRSLLAVQKIMINDKHCFELYGYDFLFDDDLKPWLIEVNASPSLSANTREDYDLKFKLLHDLLDIIDLEGRASGKETNIGGFDLIWNNGHVCGHTSEYRSMLGCDFDRTLNNFSQKSNALWQPDQSSKKSTSAAPPKSGASGKQRPASGRRLVRGMPKTRGK